MFDGMSYATTRELVEAVVTTLDLPLGLVDRAEIDRWRDGLAARGWQLDARRAPLRGARPLQDAAPRVGVLG
jgi:hypothetical protein